jgi:hypothetical protein
MTSSKTARTRADPREEQKARVNPQTGFRRKFDRICCDRTGIVI